jgi:hypothetical protein
VVWDFCEVNPFSTATGGFAGALEWVASVVDRSAPACSTTAGQYQVADACSHPLPDASCTVWFTDPPYYDAVPYADLSDFFFVWLKRALPGHPLLRDPFDPQNPLTPKKPEIVQDESKEFEGRPKDRTFFEERMAKAFAEGRRVLREDGIGCVVFAHKTTEGWEALLTALWKARWTITASWPIATEMETRLRARESAALATSVHLVLRPRSEDAGVGDWAEVKAEMERRVREWMKRLLDEGIRGADAIFSCIGPALEVYSRYARVETPAGHEVPLGGDPGATEPHERGFLAYVFEAVSREALRQVLGEAETEGFEEDARLTALFLWTLQTTRANGNNAHRGVEEQEEVEGNFDDEEEEERERPAGKKGGLALPFDTFIRLTRPMGIHYQHWLGRIIEIQKGVVRLIPVEGRREALLDEDVTVPAAPVFDPGPTQLSLFPPAERQPKASPGVRRVVAKRLVNLTTLDRLHKAMLLFAAGQTAALRRLLEGERRQGRRFERLALALTALYPQGTPERRWLEGVQTLMRR